MSEVTSILKRAKKIARGTVNHGNYFLAYLNLLNKKRKLVKPHSRTTVFMLQGMEKGWFDRTLYALALPFLTEGPISFSCDWRGGQGYNLFSNSDEYGRMLLGRPDVTFEGPNPKPDRRATLVHDGRDSFVSHTGWGRVIHVNYDFASPPPTQPFRVLPFTMHPLHYQRGHATDSTFLEDHRIRSRGNRVFFAGAVGPEYEAIVDSGLSGRLELLSRNKVVQATQKHPLARTFSSFKSLCDSFASNSNSQIHLLPTHNDNMATRLDGLDWMDALARYDFFLCAPGFSQPLCHNLVESMAVGCIPILNYANWLCPSLVPNKNCLVFSDEVSLLEVLDRATSMTAEEIAKLKSGALSYFEDYLQPSSTAKRFREVGADQFELFVVSSASSSELKKVSKNSVIFAD